MLDRVTITGADDTVRPEDLWRLSREFPFVEWALLFKYRHDIEIKPRWPRLRWLESLFDLARGKSETPQFALHLCGRALIRFLEGSPAFFESEDGENGASVPGGLLQLCRRIQLNTHGEPTGWAPTKMAWFAHSRLPLAEIICQIDGGAGEAICNSLLEEEVGAVAFFDLSHGAGVLPDRWPSPEYIGDCGPDGEQQYAYHGYGGGLGPDNLEAEIPRILEAAKGHPTMTRGRIWIDMETKVRSIVDGRDVFDLDKVRRCLEIAAPFVGKTE